MVDKSNEEIIELVKNKKQMCFYINTVDENNSEKITRIDVTYCL